MKKSDSHLTARPMLSLGQKHHKGCEHARESHAVLEALLLTDLFANLSLHEIHADMEALSTRGMGQAKVFCRQQRFQFQI